MAERFNPAKNVYWDMYTYEKSHWWYKALREIVIYWIKKSQAKVILDAGCGTGTNMAFFKKEGLEVSGIDISEEALDFCRKQNLTNLKKAEITKIPYPENTFEAITCLDVFGNLSAKELDLTLAEFYRCLKPNGVAIINTGALPWLQSHHDLTWDIQKRYYTKELVGACTKQGFTIKKATYRVTFLFPLVMISRLLERLHKSEDPRGDTHKTNQILNFVFSIIMSWENSLLKIVDLPIGSSVFVVAKKLSK